MTSLWTNTGAGAASRREFDPDLARRLTAEERAWLDAHRDSIRYAPNPFWPPGDYIENGEHKGIVSDYIRIFEERLGITFSRRYLESWPKMLDALRDGSVDFIGCVQKTPAREVFLSFTSPFMHTRLSLVVRAGAPRDFPAPNLANLQIASPEGYSSTEFVKRTFPDAIIHETNSDLDALLRVSAGVSEVAVVDYMVASHLIEKYGIGNLRFGPELDFHWELGFAVRKDLVLLRSILEKALGTIGEEERLAIQRKWIPILRPPSPGLFERYKNEIVFSMVLGVLALLAAVGFSMILRQKVNERTRELSASKAQLEESRTYLQAVLDAVGDAIFVHDGSGARIIDINHRMCVMYRTTREEALAGSIEAFSEGAPPYDEKAAREWMERARGNGPTTFEWHARRPDGSLFWVEVTVNHTRIGGQERFVVAVRDIDSRRRQAEEADELRMMLFQSQKMESVGRLAGGVAHDFNNILTVIIGNSEMIRSSLGADDPMRTDLEEILVAGQQASEITRQLLAFSRKQIVNPQTIELNGAVSQMLRMLRRLISLDVDLTFQPSPDPLPVSIDASQLNQILINLCVNARDALTAGGTINLSLEKIQIEANSSPQMTEVRPGAFALLTVQDDGTGMDEETRSHIFEPFFTTKETGKGTGLGLATVYGIVKQNGGFIKVNSAPGDGTRMLVHLPCIPTPAGEENPDANPT